MRLGKFLFVGCLSLVSLASHAETLNGLYQVREPVSSQSPEERDQATVSYTHLTLPTKRIV